MTPAGRRTGKLLARFGALVILAVLAGCATTAKTEPERARDYGAVFPNGAVAADHPMASEAGAQILRAGGNAVDAAVAASFCLSVVRPHSCGIGGGGFMIIHLPPDDDHADARQVALCYRERCPAAVGPDYFQDASGAPEYASRFGPKSVGVPGTVAGLLYALEHYGTLDRGTVMAPAIAAARYGYPADASHVKAADVLVERLEAHPELMRRAWFLREQICEFGLVVEGDIVQNHPQARALELIAKHGAGAFYRGPIGQAVVAAMEPGGGAITMEDLAAYEVEVTEPLRGEFQGREILTMPSPSSGGIAQLQILGMLDRYDGDLPQRFDPTGPDYVHLVTESMKHAFADRSHWLADAAFAPVPVEALLAPWYLDDRAANFDPGRTLSSDAYGTTVDPLPEDGGTSHISVIDANGGAVACTETINLRFGSLVAVPGFGFALNDEMDDFTTTPGAANEFGLVQSERNAPEPGKRPLSSMSPTIVLRDGRVELVVGASGGPRIITGTLQCMLRALVFEEAAPSAVAAPRFHHQWQPDVLQFEERWSADTTIDAVRALGHETGVRTGVGDVQMLKVVDEGISAASDPRKGGAPAGY